VTFRGEAIRSQRWDLVLRVSRGQAVSVTQLIRLPETRDILLPGQIHGYYETPIYAKINGYIKTMLVDKGSLVRSGPVVATIESPETD
jgi:multidrug efflux system membrane fusion protein